MFKKMIAIVLSLTMVFALGLATVQAATVRVESPDSGMLPLREVAEALGATVGWNGETRTVTINKDGATINISVDEPLAGGLGVPVIIDDRTFVPYAFIVEQLNAGVEWYQNVAYISGLAQVTPVPMPEVDPITPQPEVDPVPPVPAAEGLSAYELLNLANDAMIEAGSILMTIESLTVIEVLGETIEMPMTGTIAQVIRSATDMDMRMESTVYAEGEMIESVVYFRNNVMYINMFGEWMTMEMPLEDLLAQTGIVTFPEHAIISQQAVGRGDGTELNFVISGQAMTSLLDGAFGAMGMGDLGLNEIAMNIGDVLVTSVIDADGVFVSTDMQMDATMEFEGISMSMSTFSRFDVVQMGGVTINFPQELGGAATFDDLLDDLMTEVDALEAEVEDLASEMEYAIEE